MARLKEKIFKALITIKKEARTVPFRLFLPYFLKRQKSFTTPNKSLKDGEVISFYITLSAKLLRNPGTYVELDPQSRSLIFREENSGRLDSKVRVSDICQNSLQLHISPRLNFNFLFRTRVLQFFLAKKSLFLNWAICSSGFYMHCYNASEKYKLASKRKVDCKVNHLKNNKEDLLEFLIAIRNRLFSAHSNNTKIMQDVLIKELSKSVGSKFYYSDRYFQDLFPMLKSLEAQGLIKMEHGGYFIEVKDSAWGYLADSKAELRKHQASLNSQKQQNRLAAIAIFVSITLFIIATFQRK